MRNSAESAGHGVALALCEEGHKLLHHTGPGMDPRGSSRLASLAAVWVLQSCISPTACICSWSCPHPVSGLDLKASVNSSPQGLVVLGSKLLQTWR